jgi:phosphatidylinositol 4-kinase
VLTRSEGLKDLQKGSPTESSDAELVAFKSQMAEAVAKIRSRTAPYSVPDIRRILLRASSVLASSRQVRRSLAYGQSQPLRSFRWIAISFITWSSCPWLLSPL